MLLVMLIFFVSFIYTNLMTYCPFLLTPILRFLSINGINGLVVTAITIILMNFAGALIIASLFSFPLGYITKERSVLFGFLLGLGLLLYTLWLHLHLYQEPWWKTFNTVVAVCEYVGIMLAFIIMSKVGAYVRYHRK